MNHEPFNGDTYIGPEIRRLIKQFYIQTIIETGTWSGHTTREFATMGPAVWTIDSTHEHLIEEFGMSAAHDLYALGVRPVLGDSSKMLKDIIRKVKEPILFYLDAHGGGANGSNVNPIKEELQQIADYCSIQYPPVICIHDFYVPGKDFGYNGGDWGKGFEPLSFLLIKPFLDAIYLDGYGSYYNEKADGATRGIIYVHP